MRTNAKNVKKYSKLMKSRKMSTDKRFNYVRNVERFINKMSKQKNKTKRLKTRKNKAKETIKIKANTNKSKKITKMTSKTLFRENVVDAKKYTRLMNNNMNTTTIMSKANCAKNAGKL